jgi:hypothetical protein
VLRNEVEQSPIRARDVESARALISEALSRRFFRDRFESASEAEQRYLSAMADLGDDPVRTVDVALRAGYRDVSGGSLLRRNLLRKDLIYSPRAASSRSRSPSSRRTCANSTRSRAAMSDSRRNACI